MDEGKRAYKEGFAKLKELKGEIEHLQHLLEQSRRRLQQDFETWFDKQQGPPPQGPPPQGAPPQGAPPMPPGGARPAGGAPSQPAECWGSPGKPSQGGGAVAMTPGAPALTGQPEVDAEIMAFYHARDSLVKSRMANAGR